MALPKGALQFWVGRHCVHEGVAFPEQPCDDWGSTGRCPLVFLQTNCRGRHSHPPDPATGMLSTGHHAIRDPD